jgi:hypothetical protein
MMAHFTKLITAEIIGEIKEALVSSLSCRETTPSEDEPPAQKFSPSAEGSAFEASASS